MNHPIDVRSLISHRDHLAESGNDSDVQAKWFQQLARPGSSGQDHQIGRESLAATQYAGNLAATGGDSSDIAAFDQLDSRSLYRDFQRVHQAAILHLMFLREENGPSSRLCQRGLELSDVSC